MWGVTSDTRVVDAAEARLLVGHRAAPEDRLEVHPLALDRVEDRQQLVERGELLLKVGDAVGEAAEEWTLFERAEQGLQVGDLRRQILPVFDQRDLAAARVGVLRQRERGLGRPARHLADRLADGNLARRARVERLHLLGAVDERLPRREEVAERQLREVDLLDAQLAEERRPVLLLEGLAAHVPVQWEVGGREGGLCREQCRRRSFMRHVTYFSSGATSRNFASSDLRKSATAPAGAARAFSSHSITKSSKT